MENIVVGVIIVGFLVFATWGLREAGKQAKEDLEAARSKRGAGGQVPARQARKR